MYIFSSLDIALQVVFPHLLLRNPYSKHSCCRQTSNAWLPSLFKVCKEFPIESQPTPKSENKRALHKQVSSKKRGHTTRKWGNWDLFWEKLMALLSGTVMDQLFQKHKLGQNDVGASRGTSRANLARQLSFTGSNVGKLQALIVLHMHEVVIGLKNTCCNQTVSTELKHMLSIYV